MINRVKDTYKKLFKEEPLLISSPGRVNLIGEHTDYNDGYVLPAAIDKNVILAIGASGTDECKIYSSTLNEIATFNLNDLYKKKGWINYVLGVVAELKEAGHEVAGFNAVFDSEIPVGAGLSSSAAIEGAFGYGLAQLFDLQIDRAKLARIGQLAEHNYAGVKCGIMDQFANLHGKKNSLVRLDCRDLTYEYYPFNFPDYKIVLCNSMVHHSLASSEYNTRRKQCEIGVSKLQKHDDEIINLRDVSPAFLEEHKADLTEEVYRRCRYVVSEIKRVEDACLLLQQKDLAGFGQKMYETHEGLSKDYEVSCSELDYLVVLARKRAEVVGARMMGGGFGGCTINIVHAEEVHEFSQYVKENYKKILKKEPEIYITDIEEGVHIIS